MNATDPAYFTRRLHGTDVSRPGDVRDQFQRDRARIVHSAAFRRLQGKTQVMGVGEGDFHRTRLTHSIECAQIGNGLLEVLKGKQSKIPAALDTWLPTRDLIEAACFAHDLGHPPFGHGGEKALHREMIDCGGFEGNGQTLRIISRLEKYKQKGWGIDPTTRLVLAVLKYPISYGMFDVSKYKKKPPKCYFNEEKEIVEWAIEGFSNSDKARLLHRDEKDKSKYSSFDASLMELADDIAYGIHDIEDIAARQLASREEIENAIVSAFEEVAGSIGAINASIVNKGLFGGSFQRKQIISELVNLFVTNVTIHARLGFDHPLLEHRAGLPEAHAKLLSALKGLSFELVIGKAEIQQLEQRGQRIVSDIFNVLKEDPSALIPSSSWKDADDDACSLRRVCDYVAGMTDGYAEKVYRRLFVPGFGSSRDEL